MKNKNFSLDFAKPEIIEVNLENAENIKYENIVAFSFARMGAMGDEGQLTVVHLDNELKFYHTNLYYEDETIPNIVKSTYFKAFAKYLESDIVILPEIEDWKRFDMGFGNTLFIREKYKTDFLELANSIDMYITTFPGDLYANHESTLNILFNKEFINEKNKFLSRKPTILGGIIGDIVGSRFEFKPIKSKKFDLFYSFSGEPYIEKQTLEDYMKSCHFTDDTVMTIAVANALLESYDDLANLPSTLIKSMKGFGNRYPSRGYGAKFNMWLHSDNASPYNSYGNGSAMRISAVPYFEYGFEHMIQLSKTVTKVTHNHPEGIKGAEATAVAIWMALHNYSKEEIKKEIETNYYNLDFNYDELLKTYKHDETCQNSVPQSIFAFLISNSYEDTIRTAVSMGGDADTMACIAGSIAGAYYGIPNEIKEEALKYLPDEFKDIITNFENRFCKNQY